MSNGVAEDDITRSCSIEVLWHLYKKIMRVHCQVISMEYCLQFSTSCAHVVSTNYAEVEVTEVWPRLRVKNLENKALHFISYLQTCTKQIKLIVSIVNVNLHISKGKKQLRDSNNYLLCFQIYRYRFLQA